MNCLQAEVARRLGHLRRLSKATSLGAQVAAALEAAAAGAAAEAGATAAGAGHKEQSDTASLAGAQEAAGLGAAGDGTIAASVAGLAPAQEAAPAVVPAAAGDIDSVDVTSPAGEQCTVAAATAAPTTVDTPFAARLYQSAQAAEDVLLGHSRSSSSGMGTSNFFTGAAASEDAAASLPAAATLLGRIPSAVEVQTLDADLGPNPHQANIPPPAATTAAAAPVSPGVDGSGDSGTATGRMSPGRMRWAAGAAEAAAGLARSAVAVAAAAVGQLSLKGPSNQQQDEEQQQQQQQQLQQREQQQQLQQQQQQQHRLGAEEGCVEQQVCEVESLEKVGELMQHQQQVRKWVEVGRLASGGHDDALHHQQQQVSSPTRSLQEPMTPQQLLWSQGVAGRNSTILSYPSVGSSNGGMAGASPGVEGGAGLTPELRRIMNLLSRVEVANAAAAAATRRGVEGGAATGAAEQGLPGAAVAGSAAAALGTNRSTPSDEFWSSSSARHLESSSGGQFGQPQESWRPHDGSAGQQMLHLEGQDPKDQDQQQQQQQQVATWPSEEVSGPVELGQCSSSSPGSSSSSSSRSSPLQLNSTALPSCPQEGSLLQWQYQPLLSPAVTEQGRVVSLGLPDEVKLVAPGVAGVTKESLGKDAGAERSNQLYHTASSRDWGSSTEDGSSTHSSASARAASAVYGSSRAAAASGWSDAGSEQNSRIRQQQGSLMRPPLGHVHPPSYPRRASSRASSSRSSPHSSPPYPPADVNQHHHSPSPAPSKHSASSSSAHGSAISSVSPVVSAAAALGAGSQSWFASPEVLYEQYLATATAIVRHGSVDSTRTGAVTASWLPALPPSPAAAAAGRDVGVVRGPLPPSPLLNRGSAGRGSGSPEQVPGGPAAAAEGGGGGSSAGAVSYPPASADVAGAGRGSSPPVGMQGAAGGEMNQLGVYGRALPAVQAAAENDDVCMEGSSREVVIDSSSSSTGRLGKGDRRGHVRQVSWQLNGVLVPENS